MAAHSGANPVIEQQKIKIRNKRGENLVGLLHDTGSKEIVILCHGFLSNKEQQTIANLAFALEKEGITAFHFDFAGNGESEGSFEVGNLWGEAEDLRAVIEYFNEANRTTHAILGHSKGAGVVLLYASKYHDIRTVINVSGRCDLKKGFEAWLGEQFMEKLKEDGFLDVKDRAGSLTFHVTEETLVDLLNTDIHKACLQIDKECRVFTIHGSADELVPVENALEFAEILPNHTLHIIEGANHIYASHQAELVAIVLNSIKATLQQDKGIPT